MNILIIAGADQAQASTVIDSISSLWEYGTHSYTLKRTINGELDTDFSGFEGILIHYSAIGYPHKYHAPLSPSLTIRIRYFKGLKLATVQDEQRGCLERLAFLNGLRISHLFSVSPPNLIETLYPSKIRNFTVSTILTGYVSEDHISRVNSLEIENAKVKDVVYRGRELPEWYGHVGSQKSNIAKSIASEAYKYGLIVDVDSSEASRIYGDKWFDFLNEGLVAVGTPSGSDFLDMYGVHSEPWVPRKKTVRTFPKPINAAYSVISPRVFDYISNGCLLALTRGSYSDIPIKNRHYLELNDDASNITEIVKFAKSHNGLLMRKNAISEILLNQDFHISAYVKAIEAQIDSIAPTENISRVVITKELETDNCLANLKSFIKYILLKVANQDYLNLALKFQKNVKIYIFNLTVLLRYMPPRKFIMSNTTEILNIKFLESYKNIIQLVLSIPTLKFEVRTSTKGDKYIGISDENLNQIEDFEHLRIDLDEIDHAAPFFFGLLNCDTFFDPNLSGSDYSKKKLLHLESLTSHINNLSKVS